MPNSRFYSSIAAVTALQVTANPGDTSIQVASSSGWPGSFPFIISLDYGAANEELVLVTAGGPSSFTVTRAYDGTSASTHNAGAVVRHVSSAIDFTDSRTHEAAVTAHGISGQFVDTVSVQTMSNKTMTSPTINNPAIANPTITGGGSLAGTFSGTPTHSGTTTFTNGIVVSGLSSPFSRTNTTDPAVRVKTDAASFSQLIINADGKHTWGSGAATGDASLERTGVGVLGLTGGLTTTGGITATQNITTLGTLSAVNMTVSGNASIVTITNNVAFTGQPTFTPVTATDAAVFTQDSAWSLDSAAGRKAAGVTTIRVNVERVLATTITASSSGNIPDTVVGTLNAGWRPIDGTMITNYDKGGVAEGSISIGNDGICTIKSLSPTATIDLGATVNFSLTFVNAT